MWAPDGSLEGSVKFFLSHFFIRTFIHVVYHKKYDIVEHPTHTRAVFMVPTVTPQNESWQRVIW